MIDMLHSSGPAFSTYHLAHPRPVHWRELFVPVTQALGLKPVTYDVWLQQLKESSDRLGNMTPDQEVEEMRRNPALKILDHFEHAGAGRATPGTKDNGLAEEHAIEGSSEEAREALGLAKLSVTQAELAAPSLREDSLPQLTAEDAMRWLQHWKSVGYLN